MADPTLELGARAAKLLVERQAQDALYGWVPTRPQADFLGAQEGGEPVKEAWMIGANRGGKSDGLAAAIAAHARFGHPDPTPAYAAGGRIEVRDRAVALWVIGLTRQLVTETLQPKVFDNGQIPPGQPHPPFIPTWEVARHHITDQLTTLKMGSIIGWRSCDQGHLKFEAAGRDGIYFDEAPPYAVYSSATMRVEAGRRLLIRGAATLLPPEGMVGGVSWLYPKKIQPWLAGARQGLHLVKVSLRDNPHLLPAEVEALERKYPPGSLDYRIRILGEWIPGVAGAMAYSNFTRAFHVNPALTRVAKEWRHPLRWSLDWNVQPFGTVVCQKLGRLWRVLDCPTVDSGNIRDMVDLFVSRFPQHGAELWIGGDASDSVRRHVQTGQNNFTVLLGHLRTLPYRPHLVVPIENPPQRSRVNAVNGALRSPTGEVRLEIAGDGSCDELIDDLEQVLLKDDGTIKKATDRRDPYSRRTAWSDALGYEIHRDEPVVVADPGARKPLDRVPGPGYTFGGRR